MSGKSKFGRAQQSIKNKLTRQHLIFYSLIGSAGVLLGLFFWSSPDRFKNLNPVSPPQSQTAPAATPATAANPAKPALNDSSTGTAAPSPSRSPGLSAAAVSNTAAPVEVSQFAVSLAINGQGGAEVVVPDGANQCDVLAKALEQNKIASLDMRYDANYGSYGVYKINGIGQSNQVWWTYKVNGTSPPQGCSYIKANPRDNVAWEYKGSN